MNNSLFHVIWTTYDEFPVWDKNGKWQNITKLYGELEINQVEYKLSHKLYDVYSNNDSRSSKLTLSENAVNQLKADIETLCQEDRIMDGIEMVMLKVSESSVEMLVFSLPNSIHQKVARLKSRTSTLLSMKIPDEYFGKGTWGKGFWYSEIFSKEELAITKIKTYH